MIVWLVCKNGKPDEIFDNEQAALLHRKNLTKKWNLTDIYKMEIKSL